MADESVLRLRIEADTTGLQTGLNRAEGEMGQFATETRKVEQQLKETAAAADKASTEFVKLADKSHASFGQMTVAFTGATVAGNALLAALDGLTRGLAAPVLEILDAEESAALLAGTFQGLQSEIDKVTTLAKELSAIGPIFDDDNLSRAAAQLRLFGANADAIQQLLPYVNNLAMAFGIDVADAAKLVGQALNGQVRALGNLVPEIRTATSQTEVLAAIQGTAARNAQIAEKRMAGLGGQLALVKRQLGDAAQAFGNLLLPAMQQVLSFINANMMPALGKLAGAFVAIQTYFSNLGKGLDLGEITRRVGEAIIRTEESFAKVEPRIIKAVGKIKGVLKDLTLQGTFATQAVGKAAAAAAAKPAQMQAVQQYAQPIGPAVPPGLPTYSAAENLASIREADRILEAQRRADLAMIQYREAVQQRMLAAEQRWADESMAIQDEIARKQVNAARSAAETFSSVTVSLIEGRVTDALSTASKSAAKGMIDQIADDATVIGAIYGDGLATAVQGVTPNVVATFEKLVSSGINNALNAIQRIFDAMRKIEETFKKYREDSIKLNEKAKASFEERQADFLVGEGKITAEEGERRKQAIRFGESALGLVGGPEGMKPETAAGFTAGMRELFTDLTKDPTTAARVRDALAGGQEQLFNLMQDLIKEGRLTEQEGAGINWFRSTFFTGRGEAVTSDLMTKLIDFFEGLPKQAEMPEDGKMPEAATIQQGTSPDRPVYVFDVRPRDAFAFAPESFFFRNRGADTSRAVAGSVSLPAAQSQPVAPRQVRPGDRPPSRIA